MRNTHQIFADHQRVTYEIEALEPHKEEFSAEYDQLLSEREKLRAELAEPADVTIVVHDAHNEPLDAARITIKMETMLGDDALTVQGTTTNGQCQLQTRRGDYTLEVHHERGSSKQKGFLEGPDILAVQIPPPPPSNEADTPNPYALGEISENRVSGNGDSLVITNPTISIKATCEGCSTARLSFKITCQDGYETEGTLNDNGESLAEVSDTENYELSFPNLENDDWAVVEPKTTDYIIKESKKIARPNKPSVVIKMTVHHVVVAFEGWNMPFIENAGKPIPKGTKDNRVIDILEKVSQGLDGQWTKLHTSAYSSDSFDLDMGKDLDAKSKAQTFIEKNLPIVDGKRRGKLCIYGYSVGGDTAVELAGNLEDDYIVDLLITVDAATLFNIATERRIPAIVKRNVNFWTPHPNSKTDEAEGLVMSKIRHGGENRTKGSNTESYCIVQNFVYPTEDHASISTKTKQHAIDLIRGELQDFHELEIARKVPLELVFDGTKVLVLSGADHTMIGRLDAVSGTLPHSQEATSSSHLDPNTDYTTPENQYMKSAGTLPEDTYFMKLEKNMAFDQSGGAWGTGGWKIGSEDLRCQNWGRGGFYLTHDGGARGTNGNIGLASGVDAKKLQKFLAEAWSYGQRRARLHVVYDKKARKIRLRFNGTKLDLLYEDEDVPADTFPARSGLPPHHPKIQKLIDEGRTDLDPSIDYRDPKYQDVPDVGPIEEHLVDYELILKQSMPFDPRAIGGGWGIGGWRLEAGLLYDAKSKILRDASKIAEKLTEKLKKKLGRSDPGPPLISEARSGFFLHHDGGGPGTSGCIGVESESDMKRLQKRLSVAWDMGQGTVAVEVKYE